MADRLDLRSGVASKVILAVAGIAVATCVALAGVTEGSWIAVGLMAVLGAVSFPIYSLTIAITADWLPTAKLISGSAVLVRVNGVGALVGPLVAFPARASAGAIALMRGQRTRIGDEN